jgi:hypothetical protein
MRTILGFFDSASSSDALGWQAKAISNSPRRSILIVLVICMVFCVSNMRIQNGTFQKKQIASPPREG